MYDDAALLDIVSLVWVSYSDTGSFTLKLNDSLAFTLWYVWLSNVTVKETFRSRITIAISETHILSTHLLVIEE